MARPPDSARRAGPSDDDSALRWDDLDDPSYSDPSLAGLEPQTVEPTSGDAPTDSESRHEGLEGALARGEHPPRRSGGMAAITALGALIFAAYSLAWVIGVGSLPLSGPTLLIEVLYQFAEFLAIIASALWFGATVVLTRRRPGARAAWFALGTLVLLPWPFVFGVIG